MSNEKTFATNVAILEFVTVAAEYCAMLERLEEYDKKILVDRMQKLLPLLYLKASLLPKINSEEEGVLQSYITESDWNAIFFGMKDKLGEDADYLEVFDDRMEDSDAPIVASLAENFADIYQDLRDFLTNFHLGTEEIIIEALWQLNQNFSDYWGQYTVNALRAIHHIITKKKNIDEF